MLRWLSGALLFCASFVAAACPICMGAYQPTVADQLVQLRRAVIAVPNADGSRYRIVEVIKGERPAGGVIGSDAVQLKTAAAGATKSLLLVSDEGWPMWVSLGAIGAEHAAWLRTIAAGKRSIDSDASEWRARVALMLPYLENREPLVAQIAYGELAAAPYAALLPAKPRLSASAIRQWVADPTLAARQPLYLLLLGIAGDAQDAARIEQRLEQAWQAGDVAYVSALAAADLQLRGASRVAWVDERYLTDRKRSSREIEAALLALSVHGNANGPIPRERVIASYRKFMAAHPDIAGYVAQDLAAWQYWDAVPEYVALMKSDVKQQYPSRLAIVAYLRQSPWAKAGGNELLLSKGLPLDQSAVRGAGTLPVLPQ